VAINGTIDVIGVDGLGVIRVSGEKRVRADTRRDAEEGLDRLDVVVTETATQVLARTDQPHMSEGKTYTVDYTIEMPADMVLDINHVNGDIDVVGSENDVNVNLVNGMITADLTLRPGGAVQANLINGTIEVMVPTSTSAMLACTITNGSIDSSNLNITNESSTSRTLHGQLGEGDGTITLSTVNGAILLTGRG